MRFAGDAEVGHHEIEKLRDAQARVEHKGRENALLVQPFEQLVDQRGLAGSHFAGQQDEAFAGLNSVRQAGQRFLRVRRQEKITRVRIDVKRILFESEELLIHAIASWIDCRPQSLKSAQFVHRSALGIYSRLSPIGRRCQFTDIPKVCSSPSSSATDHRAGGGLFWLVAP